MRKLLLLALLPACVIDTPEFVGPDADLSPDTELVDGGPDDVTLTVDLDGNSTGTVTGEGIACPDDCTVTVTSGTTVTLTAAPDANTAFAGWSGGGCTGTDPCQVTLTADTTIDATFDLVQHVVTITPGGNGAGTITSNPGGIDCGADCDAAFDHGADVTLTAASGADSTFVGWTGGGCTGTDPCVVDVTADVVVEASFALDNSIIVTLAGNGDGRVTSDVTGIDCGDDCSEAYSPGTEVVLTAQATGDSTFDGWSGGGCSGTGPCTVTTDAAVLVTATFVLNQHTLTVSTGGSGAGTVTSDPAGIDCGDDCDEAYDSGTMVELTATPTEGRFAGWSLPCSGTGVCELTMSADRSVTATFTLITIGNVSSTSANGIYTTGATIPITITFSEPVLVTGTPTLALDTGGVATYGGGSFTSTLTFNYVVGMGHATGDLDYAATDALALNGGTIQDALGNNATLTLPAPGAADSLGATKAIVIDAVLPTISAIGGVGEYQGSTSASLTYTLTEVHPGTTSCTLTAGTGTISTCTTSGATLTGLTQGPTTVRVTHTDTAGNTSAAQTRSWIVDTIAPVVSAISGPSTPSLSTSATLTYSVTELNLGLTTCTQTVGTGTQTACTETMAAYANLSSGDHTVSVSHTDLAGNVSTSKTHSWTSCPSTPFTFTTVSTGTAFTVPNNICGSMDIYAWGAGGGYAYTGGAFGDGGGGGFAGGTLAVTSGQMFSVAVGGGGGAGSANSGSSASGGAGGTNGGGPGGGGLGGEPIGGGGGGGGWSGVYAGSTYYVIAAGGGGGPRGGAGGGLNGAPGTGGVAGGSGGTQSAGGAPGVVGGTAGSSLQGGDGDSVISTTQTGGGGGGGGYFGGGGGSESAGGGGGSSFTAGALTGGTTTSGSGSTAGNTDSPFYINSRGNGATTLTDGNAGLVVIVIR